MKSRFWTKGNFSGLIEIDHFLQNLFWFLKDLLQLSRNLPLLAWTQGQILESPIGLAARSTASVSLWEPLWLSLPKVHRVTSNDIHLSPIFPKIVTSYNAGKAVVLATLATFQVTCGMSNFLLNFCSALVTSDFLSS